MTESNENQPEIINSSGQHTKSRSLKMPEWLKQTHAVQSIAFFLASLVQKPPIRLDSPAFVVAKTFVHIALALYFLIVAALIFRVFIATFFGSADEVNKLLLAVAGVVGGPFLIWRTFIAHQQTSILRESNLTALFTSAVEQLGAVREKKNKDGTSETESNLEVRLGAIYALKRIAMDSERDHTPIMEVLCAYVRAPSNCGKARNVTEKVGPKYISHILSFPRPSLDVAAALNVLGLRDISKDRPDSVSKYRMYLAFTNLQNAEFKGNFSEASFATTSLQGADFNWVPLVKTNFYRVGIQGAYFKGADLRGASLLGAQTDTATFEGADLEAAYLFNTDLSHAEDLTTEQLSKALGDASTLLPEGIERPSNWSSTTLSEQERDDRFEQAKADAGLN